MIYPRISVVTVSFNQGNFLESTIRSVLDQQYPNLEYIIIDGGSTDNSVEIIKKYAQQLAYWVSEPDRGMYDGLQKGLSRCTGDIMCWINSDDLYYPHTFSVIAEIFSELPEVQWLQGTPAVADEKGRTVWMRNFRKWCVHHLLLDDPEHIQQESTFWRKSLWDKSGGTLNTSMKFAGDFDLWCRFFPLSPLHCVNTILGAFRIRTGPQLSVTHSAAYAEEARQSKNELLTKLNEKQKKVYARIGSVDASAVPALLIEACPRAVVFDKQQMKFRLE